MAVTPSTMLPLGTAAPEFKLPDTSGKLVSRDDFKSAPALLVMFICNHCPYVKHIRHALAAFGRDYAGRGLAMVAINANDARAYPDDRPELMAKEAQELGYVFPYLYDEAQATAQAFRAACTPEFYLFDSARTLVYRGQFDDSRPGNNKPITGSDLRTAVDAVLAGKKLPADQKPGLGCNIKWRPGNEPDYFRRPTS